jgi:putative permease
MMQMARDWYRQYFADPEAIILLLTLLVLIGIFWLFGAMLAPVLVSIVLAYLLNSIVKALERVKFPHVLAVSIVCLLFMGLVFVGLFWLFPLLGHQTTNLFNELPNILTRGQDLLLTLPSRYPTLISADQITAATDVVKTELAGMGKGVLAVSLAFIPNLIELIVYVILVPLLMFFFLKDSKKIMNWMLQFLPKKRRLIKEVWLEVNQQTANYVRGRIIEMFLVGIVTSITFKLFGLQYAVLLGVIVGIATFIPYIGAVVSTIPVVVIAFVQWGWSAQFAYLLIAYTVISILDSNVLVPLLFSETMNLHPIAIIVAVIVFGGLWGFWGIFFAIPLASLVQTIIVTWPRQKKI